MCVHVRAHVSWVQFDVLRQYSIRQLFMHMNQVKLCKLTPAGNEDMVCARNNLSEYLESNRRLDTEQSVKGPFQHAWAILHSKDMHLCAVSKKIFN